MTTQHIIQWSGGITSWATACRIAEKYGTDSMTLLFADTRAEDEDLYRFSEQAAASIGLPVTVVADGRTPQEVSRDRKFLASNRVPLCSHLLKQKPCRDWLTEHTDPAETVLYVGIDWTEMHRIPGVRKGWAPWQVEFPLTEPPYVDKRKLMTDARALGIEPPRLYGLGFAHNNCGGACVRGGQGQWAHLLKTFPDRFASWETFEQEMRGRHGGGETRPLPLTLLRSRVEAEQRQEAAQGTLFDADDWGGCGCMLDMSDGAA